MSATRILESIGRLQERTAGTPYEVLVDALVDALADDPTVADLRQEVAFRDAEIERLRERIDNFMRQEWSFRNRAEVAERGHQACLARERDRGR